MVSENGGATSAAHSWASWIARSPWKAAAIVLLLLLALAGSVGAITRSVVADGYERKIRELRGQLETLKQEAGRRDGQWRAESERLRARTAAAEARHHAARKKLEDVRRDAERGWVEPAGPADVVKRLEAIGVRGEGVR